MGIKDVYPWGKEWPPPVGAGNYAERLKVDKFEYTSPWGSFAANKMGLHDYGRQRVGMVRGQGTAQPARPCVARCVLGTAHPDDLLSSYRYYGTPDRRYTTSAFGVCWWVVPVGEVGFVTLWPCPLEP